MFRKTTISLAAAVLFTPFVAIAQTMPATNAQVASPSPLEHASVTVEGHRITVDYGAPSLRGRKILGDLIQVNKVWPMGDNGAITFKTPIDLKIGDVSVPAGTYTLYTIVTPKGYWLIINKQTGQSGDAYDQSQDLGRARLNANDTDGPIERFLIDFEYTHDKKTELHLKWGYTESWVHITAQ